MESIGRVVERILPSGRVAFRIDFGKRGPRGRRRRVYLDSVPGEFGRGRVGFRDRAHAEDVLRRIQAELTLGRSVERVLAEIRSTTAPEDRIESRLEEWIGYLEGLERQGRRSPTYVRNLRSYARPDGHFGFWWGRSIHGVTHGDVEDWLGWLGERRISPRTVKHVADAFRGFVRRLERRGEIEEAPEFPAIEVPEYLPKLLPLQLRAKVLEAIPWECRGAFLAGSWLLMRAGEIRACNLDDVDGGQLRVGHAMQGATLAARRHHTKARVARARQLWHEELARWVAWRLGKVDAEERLAGKAIALFWNPRAQNPERRWTEKGMAKTWRRACRKVGVEIPLREGTRHSTATALLEGGLERPLLQALGAWESERGMGHYAKPKVPRAALVQAMRKAGRGQG